MVHSASRRMLRFGVTSVACLALLASGLQLVTAGSAGAATSQTYSDPVWFPVRDTVQVGCIGNHSQPTNNNDPASGKCDSDHPKYFGMNIDAIPGKNAHPVIWAAGAGIVLDATSEPVCGGTSHTGKVVEIDHGGGVVSVYEHLQSISVKVGQHVTPSTPIGTMGHSGLSCTSSVNYLDFQIRNNGGNYLNADTTSIRTMLGCNGATRETWPAGLGLPYNPTTWVQVKYLDDIDTSGGTCYPSGTGNSPATPARPAMRPRIASAVLAWPAVSGANRYMVQTQIFRNGTGWEAPCSPYQTKGCTAGYTAVAGSATRATITGLLPARQYRLRFSAHNSNGWSPASGWVYATTAPTFRKFRTTTSLVEIYWSMYPATKLTSGRTIGFQVAIAKVRHGKVGTWHYAKAGASATNFTFKTRHRTRYALKVRALVSGGRGGWMKVHAVTTP